MKKRGMLIPAMAAVLVLLCCACGSTDSGEETGSDTLVVFNYGDYIDISVLDMFEEETGIHVEYESYVTPEDMYTKYQSGAIDYDVICTSDYLIEKMIQAGQVQKIDTDSLEYYDNLDETYLEICQAFDPDNEYAVPYLWGTVGICYNTKLVDEEVTSWEILWDEKYSNQIIMENSMRDAYLVPLKILGYSLNTVEEDELLQAHEMLLEQKPLVMAYLVDETRDEMIAGDAALGVIYSGDATVAMDENEDLDYVVPEEGSNIWFDCWFIPDSATNVEGAQKFIDFMCREDIAMLNFDYVYYGTPNRAVYEALDEETREDYVIFPDAETLSNCEIYQYLGEDMEATYNQLWKELKAD